MASSERSIRLFAFIAGTSDPTGSRFLAGFSVSYEPQASLGAVPLDVLRDPKFGASIIESTGWSPPSNFPTEGSPGSALQSINAHLIMSILQNPKIGSPKAYTTEIDSVRVSLSVSGLRDIFENCSLTDLKVDVLVFPGIPSTNRPLTYSAELLGTIQSTVLASSYQALFSARIVRLEDQSSRFTATISAAQTVKAGEPGFEASPSLLSQMDVFGGKELGDVNLPTVPTAFPVQKSTLIEPLTARCVVEVTKINANWRLHQITFSLKQISSWIIIPDRLVVNDATLALTVRNPRGTREYEAIASATLAIGSPNSILLGGVIAMQLAGDQNGLLGVENTAGNPQEIMQRLIATDFDSKLPPGCPAPNGSSIFKLSVFCRTKAGKANYEIDSIVFEYSPSTNWSLGQIGILKLQLDVKFSDSDDSNTKYSISFRGQALFGGTLATLIITYSELDSLQVQIVSEINCDDIVQKLVTSGLRSPPTAPTFTEDTGLADYADKPVATKDSAGKAIIGASITFKKVDVTWKADSLLLTVNSGTAKWGLVGDVLYVENLSLGLSITGLSTSVVVSAILTADFKYKLRPPATIDGASKLTLQATRSQRSAILDTSSCNLPQFL